MSQILKQNISRIKEIMGHAEKRRFLLLRTAGNFLILFALFGVIVTFAPVLIAEGGYKLQKAQGVEYKVVDGEIVRSYSADGSSPLAGLLSGGRQRTERVSPASTEFGIVIPKIGANAKVISNVDAGDEGEYQKALLQGVAHAAGTALPGETSPQSPRSGAEQAQIGSASPAVGQVDADKTNNRNRKVYLFAHSTDNWWNVNRYNAVFFLLKELVPGDEIDIFYEGRRYVYEAVETKIVGPDEVSYLVEPSKEELLVLQTCWPPGTTLKRLLVLAKPVSNLARN